MVYQEKKVDQSRKWKGFYHLISLEDESVIIELSYSPIKFRSTSIKPYFIDNKSINNNKFLSECFVSSLIQVPTIEAPTIKKSFAKVFPTKKLPIYISAISIPLASLALVKHNHKQLKKYLEQVNIASQSDICFVKNKFDKFIKKGADAQYTTFKQKEIVGLLE